MCEFILWQKEKASHIIATISIKDSNTLLIILENSISNRRVWRTTFIRFTHFYLLSTSRIILL